VSICKIKLFTMAAFTAVLLTATLTQAVPITFQVHMSYQVELGNFDPGSDFVDVAGTFNDWGDPLTQLTDTNGDTLYEITIDGFTPMEIIEFKFRINGQWDGSEEFPDGGPNRVYTVQESSNHIEVWYNDEVPTGSGIGEVHWWNDRVFYEVFVRSFQDSDGDGIGDFSGLIQKLDYLNDGDPATDSDLGITGIWLMPINDSPSYHGYDATDYRAINPDYGSMADFEAFLAAAHARGIKVIIDYVMNHCSTAHPWFEAAADNDPVYRDYFRWSPSNPGQTGPWGQDVWHWHASGWYYGLFWGGMPDLNYETLAVKTEMFDTATYWLDTIGVDGFRLDAVLYILEEGDQLQNTASTLQFWQDFNLHIKAVNPDVLSVGEAWTSTDIVLEYMTDDRLDFCFEFDLAATMLNAANSSDAGYLGIKAAEVHDLFPYLQYGTFLTNHDQDRVLNVLGHDEGKAKVAAGLYLTLPGIPFVYYGEEIGMVGSGAHEFIRSPMQWTDGVNAGFTTGTPWQPINGNYPQYNVQVEQQDPGSLLSWYKQLIAVRNQTAALRRGTHEAMVSSASPVMGFVRQHEQQTVLCLANTSAVNMSGISLTGTGDSLVPGTHRLLNLLDPDDSFEIVVSPTHEISSLQLDGHEVAIYQFVSATGVETDGRDLPASELLLGQNHPNPFNPSTDISFTVRQADRLTLEIFDVRGRQVRTMPLGMVDAGQHQARWNGNDERGNDAASGVYFMRIRGTEGVSNVIRASLVK